MARSLSPQSPQTTAAQAITHHLWALGICALALLLGVAVADDYHVGLDVAHQRAIGEATLRHLAGENGLNLLWPPSDKLYGPVVEAPLRLIERILYPDQGRGLYVARHVLTHLLFVASAFAAYLLALRMFGSRWLALFALALFLLHPRIYAHSFFNSKDVPFLSMFMICLWLAHRAFRPHHDAAVYGAAGTAGAFALCGIAAGLLTNQRVSGLTFVAVVILMRLCDAIAAGDWRERRRVIASCALFAFASIAAFYATMPYLWADPLERFGEIVRVMLAHPTDTPQLFRGERLIGSELPPTYVPIWFSISTPPLALVLGAVGFAAIVWRGGRAGDLCLRNAPLRFELLVAACFVLPVLAAIVLRPTLQGDWRHLYFLWAPFVLTAAGGLRTLVEGASSVVSPFKCGSHVVPAAAVVATLVALGLARIAVEMVRLHPHQDEYFNVLATGPDTALPLHQRYSVVDVSGTARGFAYILDELTDGEESDAAFNVRKREARYFPLDITRPAREMGLLSERDQRRFKFDPNVDLDFYVSGTRPGTGFPPVLYERRLYDQVVVRVASPDLSRVNVATADAYRALYRDVIASVPVFTSGETEVYRDETAITWVREPCPAGDVNRRWGMIVVPLDATRTRQRFLAEGVRVDSACLWQSALPEYAIAKILLPDIGALASEAYLQERRQRHAAISAAPPMARSTFDVYREDKTLFYIKTPCVKADIEAPFFMHVWPMHLGDIHHSRRRFGFDAQVFRFGSADSSWRYADRDIFDGVCMAARNLPDYPFTDIATGQHALGGDNLWRVEIGGD